MPSSQSFKNHIRYDPFFHFLIMPLLLLNLIFSIYITVHNWPAWQHTHLWSIVMAIVFILIAGIAREYALKTQSRIIRLEERLRLASLLPTTDLPHIHELTIQQLIAIRFASDAEVPSLVHKTLTQNLEPKAIKQSITHWRADHHRV